MALFADLARLALRVTANFANVTRVHRTPAIVASLATARQMRRTSGAARARLATVETGRHVFRLLANNGLLHVSW